MGRTRLSVRGVRKFLLCMAAAACLLIASQAARADVADLEKDLQTSLEQSGKQVSLAARKLEAGLDASPEIARLRTLAENIRVTHMLLEERFRLREEKARSVGAEILSRQKAMAEGYKAALTKYLSLIDSLPATGPIPQSAIRNLQSLLEKILPRKKRPLIGSLPYKHLNYPSAEPSTAPVITPAYQDGNKTVGTDDTKDTPEAPITKEIASLAQSLSWSPVSIYEYVKNSIHTEWYWGCMKGAEETLHQKSGNDCDQATLFAALLRASGFPTRYVRGSVEFITSGNEKPIDRIKNLFGIDDPANIARFLQKAGIPYKPVIAGGGIANFQIEHVWVESQIPYANYRGAIIDDRGKTWLGLDTSLKVKGYRQNQPKDVFALSALSGQLSQMRDQYLGIASSGTGSTPFELNQTPLEYLRSSIDSELRTLNSELRYADFLRSRTLIPEIMNILPAGLQFKEISITNEYTSIPEELRHKVRFTAKTAQHSELLNIELDVFKMSNKHVTISYEPESVADQETINAWGGLDNTPAYLVRLRPVLKVGGQRMAVGKDGLPMGSDYQFTVELIGPVHGSQSSSSEKTTNTLIVGNLTVIGITAQKAVAAPSPLAGEGGGEGAKDAERLLYEAAQHYIDRWNKSEEELASFLHLTIARPIPTVVTLGGVIDVTYLLDMPHGFTWKGVYLDADVKRIETVQSAQFGVQHDREKLFMQLSGLQGSVLEHRIFEDDWKVSAISTAKLIQLCTQNSALCTGVITIDKGNVDTVVPTLPYDPSIKDDMTNAVNQGYELRTLNSELSYLDWTGMGYLKEMPETAESGWMLSGVIAGGMTAVSSGKWDGWMFDNILAAPYQDSYKTVIIMEPKDGTVLPVSSIGVSGYVIDPKARVTVNGVQAYIEDNIFTAQVNLTPGMNKITAIATNAAGKQTSDTVIVKYSIPLRTAITFPFDGADISQSPIFVEGLVSDPTATVKINDITANVSSDGKFTAMGIPLIEGPNRITVTAVNQDGATDSQAITVNYKANQTPSPISVTITHPAPNAAINKPMTMVVGTVTTTANEVWVKVNGVPAVVYGNQFVINNVPLVDGSNRIVADAMDDIGAIARAEVSVNANTTAPYVLLGTNITSGIAPFTSYFSTITNVPNAAASYRIDFEGDKTDDYNSEIFENVAHTYGGKGIQFPVIYVTDDQGNVYSDTIAIVRLSKDAMDALLKNKWERAKGKLSQQDTIGALQYFSDGSKTKYQRVFEKLSPYMPDIIANMSDITLDRVIGDVAEYRTTKLENIEGQMREITYFLYFRKDVNGQWKLESL